MNIYELESSIDPIILARGREYLANDCIEFIEELDELEYRADVAGSELYEVLVTLDVKGNVLFSECDCPYNYSSVCKHQAAVLLKLQDQNGKLDPENDSENPLHSKVSLREQLEAEDKAELIDLICALAVESNMVKKQISLHLSKGGGTTELKECRELIRSYIRKFADHHGFVSWRNVDSALEGANIVANKARIAFEDTEWIRAVEINLTILQEMMDMFQSSDDSDGAVGAVIEESLERIQEITQQVEIIAQSDRKIIFELLLKEANEFYYDGWDEWRFGLIKSASCLVLTEELQHVWDNYLSEFLIKYRDSFLKEQIMIIQYNNLKSNGKFAQSQNFLNDHLEFSYFRERAIQTALENNNNEEIIRLAEEGEVQDLAKGLPGLVDRWEKHRYEAYGRLGRIELQRALGLEFLRNGDFAYYQEVKSSFSDTEWIPVYNDLLDRLGNDRGWRSEGIYKKILVEELEYARLLAFTRKQLHAIEEFHKLLYPHYPQEVIDLFKVYIEAKANRADNRKQYAEVCRIICMLIKVGGKEEAQQIVRELQAKHLRKPAFQDELRGI